MEEEGIKRRRGRRVERGREIISLRSLSWASTATFYIFLEISLLNKQGNS
jgi:hypothetical protein